MNSGHRHRGDSADSTPPGVDPADQWVLDPATGEFRLDLDAGRHDSAERPGAAPARPQAARRRAPAPASGSSSASAEAGKADGGRGRGRGASAVPGGRAARRRGRSTRGRRALKWTAGTLGLVLVAGCGGAYYVYQHFNSNISSVKVEVGDESERPQATDALNILVIGTDSRVGLGREYGDEGSAGHADTTLLFHISKDRSNATVLSIPRDLMVSIPECKTNGKSIPGEARTMFNTSLGQDGRDPGCTWKTVEKLTGVRINHFMMVNFEAVKTLSTAVGGVEVCAATNINDPYSHLKMTAGRHVVQGEEALAFVRTRHAVGLGGDLTRIPLQQQFISSMIRKMKSSDTLTSPTKLWDLADAATKALTVDDGIGSVSKLKDLALDISRVDTKNITFTTVPVIDDPKDSNRLVLKPNDAQQLFAMIAADRSLTDVPEPSAAPSAAPATTAAAAPAAPAAPKVDAAGVKVTVRNGSGTAKLAGKAADALQAKGFALAVAGNNADPAATSAVTYPAGHADEAKAVAAALGLPETAAEASSRLGAKDGVVVVLGKDFTTAGSTPSAAPTEAPKDIQRVQADDTNVCASKAK
ncbi:MULTISPECIES: LCP family protein [Kitasatospora]|uniref:Putative lytR family regulatory protein n=1 Tax=Kitasatospora setae (strain ATCC 33774 / DSM 43861 / JCM 3304 / KCC A-0304 / NBRC 14216 / KM-6054) TaxID=452652 RepID=E4NC29_KITSK|nr:MULTISPECIES: LCP family protein [Kitasatospora]BAJ28760.1 putative lytR family regulatory protein [Kitasatospora setae KM-6054]